MPTFLHKYSKNTMSVQMRPALIKNTPLFLYTNIKLSLASNFPTEYSEHKK